MSVELASAERKKARGRRRRIKLPGCEARESTLPAEEIAKILRETKPGGKRNSDLEAELGR